MIHGELRIWARQAKNAALWRMSLTNHLWRLFSLFWSLLIFESRCCTSATGLGWCTPPTRSSLSPNLLQSQSSSRWQCWPLQCKLLLFFPLLLQLTDSARPPADICWPSHFSFSACFISNFPHIIGFVFSWIFVSSLCFFVPIVITTHLSSINLRFFSIITLDIFSLGEAKTKNLVNLTLYLGHF